MISVLIASVAQMVEHHLAKVDVEGPNPFARSRFCEVGLMEEMPGANVYGN